MPKLWRFRAMRKLQHFDDASQATQPAGIPLLRIASADSQSLSEVPVEVRLFFRRRLRAPGRKAAQGISPRAHRTVGPRHVAHEATVSADSWSIRVRRTGH